VPETCNAADRTEAFDLTPDQGDHSDYDDGPVTITSAGSVHVEPFTLRTGK